MRRGERGGGKLRERRSNLERKVRDCSKEVNQRSGDGNLDLKGLFYERQTF